MKPRNKYEVTLHVSAADWLAAIRALKDLVDHVDEHGPECSSVSGGGAASHWVDIQHNPEQTPENYARELRAYVDAMRLKPTLEGEAKP